MLYFVNHCKNADIKQVFLQKDRKHQLTSSSTLLQSIITKKFIICEQISVSFLFCRHYTAFREKNQTTEEGPADRSGHTTPDAVKLVGKDIVADEASEITKKLNSNSNSKHDIINGGKITIITL